MEIFIRKDSLYLKGTIKEVRHQLREYLLRYQTLRELIQQTQH